MGEPAEDHVTLTVKIPRELLEEIELRVPKGVRSEFIREAIINKIQKIPLSERLSKIEERIGGVEDEIGEVKKILAELELLSNPKEKVSVSSFCRDSIDRKIIEFLVQHGGATTSEISRYVGGNRWLILNRLKRMKEVSERKLGKPSVDFSPIEKMGRKRAWWVDEKISI